MDQNELDPGGLVIWLAGFFGLSEVRIIVEDNVLTAQVPGIGDFEYPAVP